MDRRLDCSDRKLLINGERGRNRTYNLLIKGRLRIGTRFQTISLLTPDPITIESEHLKKWVRTFRTWTWGFEAGGRLPEPTMHSPSHSLPRWLCVVSVPSMFTTVIVVLAPELLIGALWLAGIRPERTPRSYMWPGSWGWGVIWAYSFSMIFGWAFILGLAVQNTIVNWFLGLRASLPGWLLVLFCAAVYAVHTRGYVGWVHLMKL